MYPGRKQLETKSAPNVQNKSFSVDVFAFDRMHLQYNQDKQVHGAPFVSHVLYSTNKSTEYALVCTFALTKYRHLFAIKACTRNKHPGRHAYVVRAPVSVFGTQVTSGPGTLGTCGTQSSQLPGSLGT